MKNGIYDITTASECDTAKEEIQYIIKIGISCMCFAMRIRILRQQILN